MKQTIPYNFDDLFGNAKELFQTAGFDISNGSNTSQLCAVMSYMIAALNTNTAVNINETLLPFAAKRKNVLQDARVLGYEPRHKVSYEYEITVQLNKKCIGYGKVKIPKYSFVRSGDNKYYYWNVENTHEPVYDCGDIEINNTLFNPGLIKTPEGNIADLENLEFSEYFYSTDAGVIRIQKDDLETAYNRAKTVFENNRNITIAFREGDLRVYRDVDSSGEITETENENTPALLRTLAVTDENGQVHVNQFVDLPYNNVEEDGIECFVSDYDSAGQFNQVPYKRTTSYFFERGLDFKNSNLFLRLDDIEMNVPRVYFQYAGMGKGLSSDAQVMFNILISKGASGEITKYYDSETKTYSGITFYTPDGSENFRSLNGWLNNFLDKSLITECKQIKTGTSEESNESIRRNAPKVYNTALRMITNLDYQAACNRDSHVHDSAVWGGEDEFPKAPGHIWFSFCINVDDTLKSQLFESQDSNNNEYQRKHSSLTYDYLAMLDADDAELKEQYELVRDEYYKYNYLADSEIFSEGGVLDRLKDTYVPSLTFHHRNPLYLNFDYEFKILNYNIREPESSYHQKLFNILWNCFDGDSDDLGLERFDVSYFHNTVIKRIDYALSDTCGFTCDLNTRIVLNEKTLITENWEKNYKDIYIPLCVPFEKYFDKEGYLDTSRLPSIDTENFIGYTFTHHVEDEEGSRDIEYSIVKGDLYTDWEYIHASQALRKAKKLDADSRDVSAKIFVAPVKVKMRYLCKVKSIPETIKLLFKLAPDNTKDQSFKNIQVLMYKSGTFDENSSDLTVNYDLLKAVYCDGDIKNLCDYINGLNQFDEAEQAEKQRLERIYNNKTDFTSKFYYDANDRETLRVLDPAIFNGIEYMELRFERTCGYYYLFNGFEKKILVHLFVNGTFEGFRTAAIGMQYNDYYSVLPSEVASAWSTHESDIYDDISFVDITYTEPRSYLYTVDRRYITCIEPTGKELETEPHYLSYNDQGIITAVSRVIRDEYLAKGLKFEDIPESIINQLIATETEREHEGSTQGHYITTEGYLVIDDDEDRYSGPKVREYNEAMYLYTPLITDMFKRNLYLNVKYNSMNFKVQKNVIPRLNNVKFKNANSLY